MKLLIFFLIQINVFAAAECVVPIIILETVKITENELIYPFYIRTNDNKRLNTFYKTIKNFQYKTTKDNMLIDCINKENCINLTNALIKENITNLDLGLFQINYESFKYPIYTYFDERQSYFAACKIIEEKNKIRKKWSWETLATYYSSTTELNKIYKEKLIKNYIKLTSN